MKQVIEQITMQGTHTIEIKSEDVDAIIKYDLVQIIDVTEDELVLNGEVAETVYTLKKKHL